MTHRHMGAPKSCPPMTALPPTAAESREMRAKAEAERGIADIEQALEDEADG